jgi:hypothetical protein
MKNQLNMQPDLDLVKSMRREAELVVFEGIMRGMPMGVSRIVIQKTMIAKGLPVPEDVMAFASEGQVSDADVTDWDEPRGGIVRELRF